MSEWDYFIFDNTINAIPVKNVSVATRLAFGWNSIDCSQFEPACQWNECRDRSTERVFKIV